MCGITGFNFTDAKLIKKMSDQLKHRGPDDFGYYTDEHVSLGHRRLSIIDLSKNGRQPMSNEEGDIWITYNGEVYNYCEIKNHLQENHRFMSNTDTEVLIHSYEEYGISFLKKLRGMFSFCLYDSKKRILILARDNIGKKPLYYFFNGKTFIFSSEIKAILQCNVDKILNKPALISYLTLQYTIGNQTLFNGIKKLLGGHYLIFNLETKKLEIKKYWDIKEGILHNCELFFINKLKDLLEKSAELRLRSDVPVGAFLSGGIDSSIAIAFARDKVDYDFHTFSMGFKQTSELEYSKKVADYLNTNHHEIHMNEGDIIKQIPQITWHNDEPIGDAAIIANFFLAKYAKKYVKVVLAGEAGDEIFAGYKNYKNTLRYHINLPIPKKARRILAFLLNGLPISYIGNPWNNDKLRKMQYLGFTELENAHIFSTMGITESEIQWLTGIEKKIDIFNKIIMPKNISYPLNILLALDLKNLLPEKFLMKADKATMAHGVEERLVIMDKEIVEFSYKIPPSLKIKNNRSKWILRKAGEEKLKDLKEVVWRKKQGFGVPIGDWIKGELKDYILQRLEGEFIRKNTNYKSMNTIINKVKEGNVRNYHHSLIIWTLFALEEWYEQFFL
jgi:asparagine synthase (glutamine-hydrolysing)